MDFLILLVINILFFVYLYFKFEKKYNEMYELDNKMIKKNLQNEIGLEVENKEKIKLLNEIIFKIINLKNYENNEVNELTNFLLLNKEELNKINSKKIKKIKNNIELLEKHLKNKEEPYNLNDLIDVFN